MGLHERGEREVTNSVCVCGSGRGKRDRERDMPRDGDSVCVWMCGCVNERRGGRGGVTMCEREREIYQGMVIVCVCACV